MKKTFGQTLQAIRAHPDSITDFLNDSPNAIPYAKGMVRAIVNKKIPLHGTPYEIAKRAYEYESGADKIGITMEKIFNEMENSNAKKP
jgi:hypothetical protein